MAGGALVRSAESPLTAASIPTGSIPTASIPTASIPIPTGSISTASISTAGLQALLDESALALERGQCIEGAELSRHAVQQAIELGDRPREASGLRLLSRQLTGAGNYELTAAICDQASAILRELDDQVGLCENQIVQALALHELGLAEDALDVLNSAHQVANQLNDRNLQYWVLNRIAVVHSGLQDHVGANDFQRRALALADGLDEDARFCIINNFSD